LAPSHFLPQLESGGKVRLPPPHEISPSSIFTSLRSRSLKCCSSWSHPSARNFLEILKVGFFHRRSRGLAELRL